MDRDGTRLVWFAALSGPGGAKAGRREHLGRNAVAACCLVVGLCACLADEEQPKGADSTRAPQASQDGGAGTGAPSMGLPPESAGEQRVSVAEGTVAPLSPDCQLGLGAVYADRVTMSWWALAATAEDRSVRAEVLVGSIFPACGELYRLAAVVSNGATIERKPLGETPPTHLVPRALAVPVGGEVTLRVAGAPMPTSLRLRVLSVEGAQGMPATANLELVETVYSSPDGPPSAHETRTAAVSDGGQLLVGSQAFRVSRVMPAETTLGIQGWVEVDPQSKPQ